mgnify:CR=1 FL=1
MSRFSQAFTSIYTNSNSRSKGYPAWLQQEKEQSWKAFNHFGFPQRTSEDWKYTNFSFLKNRIFQVSQIPDNLQQIENIKIANALNLVFINGRYSKSFSDTPKDQSQVKISLIKELVEESRKSQSISDALNQLKNLKGKFAKLDQDNGLIALNTACADEGFFIQLQSTSCEQEPIHLIHISTASAKESCAIFPQNYLLVADGCQGIVLESFAGICKESKSSYPQCEPSLCNSKTDIYLGQGSKLQYGFVQNQEENICQISHGRVLQRSHSHFESFGLCYGAFLSRHSMEIWQEEDYASSYLNGFYTGKDKNQCEIRTSIHHKKPHGNSSQYYKGILNGKSRGVFLGKVNVYPLAQKTHAKQLNKNLLLSSKAEADTKPILKIDTDDVKCSHGATVSQLRDEEIFYLKSRGIPEEKARKILCQGFMDETINLISHDFLKSHFKKITKRISF